ncbi:MAG: hypothetical protein O3B41_08920 [Bacteroidetes bacterium]|nr:hypothetical protein [Bacteroidota bacterium]
MESDKDDIKRSPPSFVRPFLYALNRMKANESLSPEQYIDQAKRLLEDRLGSAELPPQSAFSHGSVGLMADHTHYFDGFALALRMRQGVAIALRTNQLRQHRYVLDGVPEVIFSEESSHDEASLASLFLSILAVVGSPSEVFYDVSLVGSIPTGLGASFHAALAVSLVRVLNDVGSKEVSEANVRTQAHTALESWYGNRFSPAYVIGASVDQTEPFILIDTKTFSHLPIDINSESGLSWGIVEWSKDWASSFSTATFRNEIADRTLKDLNTSGFKHVGSLRELEHRDLESAMDAVPKRSRGPLRHLVTENRNVQKLIVALKKSDWQFLGALMMISQASKAADWSTTDPIHELVTAAAETAALDGTFGVVQSGEGKCMLVCGQPYSLPAFLDRIREIASAHTTEEVETFII